MRRGLDAVLESLFGTLTDAIASAAATQVVDENAKAEKTAPTSVRLFPSHTSTAVWLFAESLMRKELMEQLGLDRLTADRCVSDRAIVISARCSMCKGVLDVYVDEAPMEWSPSTADAAVLAVNALSDAVDAHVCKLELTP